MKRSKFSEEHIVYAIGEAESGTQGGEERGRESLFRARFWPSDRTMTGWTVHSLTL